MSVVNTQGSAQFNDWVIVEDLKVVTPCWFYRLSIGEVGHPSIYRKKINSNGCDLTAALPVYFKVYFRNLYLYLYWNLRNFPDDFVIICPEIPIFFYIHRRLCGWWKRWSKPENMDFSCGVLFMYTKLHSRVRCRWKRTKIWLFRCYFGELFKVRIRNRRKRQKNISPIATWLRFPTTRT